MPTLFFAGAGAAVSIGLINSLGTQCGLVGPYMIGSSGATNGQFGRGLCLVGGTLLVSAVTIIALRLAKERLLAKTNNQ